MAGPRSRSADANRVPGFPAGVNNVAPDFDPPKDELGRVTALREAVNVDLVGPQKKVRRRAGRTAIAAGRAHSPKTTPDGKHLLVVIDGDLRAYGTDRQLRATVRASVGPNRLTYAKVNDDTIWSGNGLLRRVRSSDLADLPAWVDCPGIPQVAAISGGNMAPGEYRVGMTWLDANGTESGCAGLVLIDLAEGECLQITGIPAAPEGAEWARVYVSSPNEAECYATADLLTSVTNTIITSVGDGVTLKTLSMQTFPPCNILRFWNTRLIGADGNLIVWSEPLRYGLVANDNYVRAGERVTLLEPIGDGTGGGGIYVADHKNTYWYSGDDPKKWRRVIKLEVPAVYGASMVTKGKHVGLQTDDPVVVWLGADGVFYAGTAAGEVTSLTEGRLAIPAGDEGAMMFREFKGIQQMIASYMKKGASSGFAFGDRAAATVTRYTNV